MDNLFLSTDINGITKLPNLMYDKYMYGYIYCAKIGTTTIGCIVTKPVPGLGKEEYIDSEVKAKIISSTVEFQDNVNKRLNSVSDWKFEAEEEFDKDAFLKYLDSQDHLFLAKNKLPAWLKITERYGLHPEAEDPHATVDFEVYEKMSNRYVAEYEIYGIKDGVLTNITANWYLKEALSIVEEQLDRFVKISIVLE